MNALFSFAQYYKIFSYLLVGCGFWALYLCDFAGPYLLTLLILFSFYSYYRDKLKYKFIENEKIWNGLLLALLIWLAVDGLFISLNLVENAIFFTIALQLNRLLVAKEDIEYLQMVLISFLQLTVSTVFTERLEFIVPFAVFLIVGVWVLTLYTIRQQVREAYDQEAGARQAIILGNSKKLVNRRFLLTTSILSVTLLLSTLIVFYLFPRVSFGFFYKKSRGRANVSGFSENIQLGEIKQIKERSRVVMRVLFSAEDQKKLKLDRPAATAKFYWRGTALDLYDGKSWRQSKKRKKIFRPRYSGKIRTRAKGQANLEEDESALIKQEIYLEPNSSKTIFALDKVAAFGWKRTFLERIVRRDLGLRRDQEAGYTFLSDYSADRNYYAESDLSLPTREQLERPIDSAAEKENLQRYLELPAQIDPRIITLAKRITAGLNSRQQKMSALEQYLLREYRYTLNVNDRGVSKPLSNFLFNSKRGHCEYFSTALAILARAVGIPSRNAVGFLGGEWNSYGDYLLVREGDAHSWVEAFFPGYGWVRFDPTPGQEVTSGHHFGTLSKIYDYLKLRWLSYIVEYDLRTQKNIASSLAKNFKKTPKIFKQWYKLKDFFKKQKKLLLSLLLLTVLLILLARKLLKGKEFFGQRGAKATQQINRKQYALFLKYAKEKGFANKPSNTPLEFADFIDSSSETLGRQAKKIAKLFNRLFYRPDGATPEVIEESEIEITKFKELKEKKEENTNFKH